VAVQGYDYGGRLTMSDSTGLAEALLGLDGFRVWAVTATAAEVVIEIEPTAAVVRCPECGTRAVAHERMRVDVRDVPCFGRPARLVWRKRRWCCAEPVCDAKTRTQPSTVVDRQAVLTRRVGAEACRQMGELARPVSEVAEELGVCWWTVMNAVIERGAALVDDPDRVGPVRQLVST
jgi:transposase